MKLSDVSIILLAMLLWAVCFPLITMGIEYAPHLTFAALRAVLAGASLVVIALALGRQLPRGLRTWIMLMAVGLGATTLGFFGMFHAAEFVAPGIATVIANTQPLLAAVLASMFLGERLGTLGKLGLGLGFIGIVLIATPRLMSSTSGSYAIGIAYIVLAAGGITVSNVLIKRIAGEVDGFMAMGFQLLLGAVPLTVIAWLGEQPNEVVWSGEFLFALVGLSLPGTALVYWLWFLILKRVPLNRANAFSFLIPILGLSMGILFYGESVGWLEMAGIVVVLAGIALVNRKIQVRTPG